MVKIAFELPEGAPRCSLAFLALLLGLAACACGQSGEGPGAVQCRSDDDCDRVVVTGIENLANPAADYPHFVRAECVAATLGDESNQADLIGSGDDRICRCETEDQTIGYLLHEGDSCLVHSRSRACLYSASEFPGCTLEQADSCTAICDDLTARAEADAAATFDASVRLNHCSPHGYCETIVDIEGQCFIGMSKVSHDCSLSDDEILGSN